LKDILGFSDKSVPKEFRAKIQGLVSLVDPRLIELTLELNYADLGCIVDLCQKLTIFTTDPNAETVQKRLAFFDMKHVVNVNDEMKSDTVTDSSESDGKHEKTKTGSRPGSQTGSQTGSLGNGSGHISGPEITRVADIEKTFAIDAEFSTGQHPYGSAESGGSGGSAGEAASGGSDNPVRRAGTDPVGTTTD
jgi:hypothetical protein